MSRIIEGHITINFCYKKLDHDYANRVNHLRLELGI